MTTLNLRVRTNPGDTTQSTQLSMEQVDDNFISLKNNKAELNSPQFTGHPTVPNPLSTDPNGIVNVGYLSTSLPDPVVMAIALG
jgi:hypothetical protein